MVLDVGPLRSPHRDFSSHSRFSTWPGLARKSSSRANSVRVSCTSRPSRVTWRFVGDERFHDVVVRTGLQAGHAVADRVAAGEHQHGNLVAAGAQPAAYGK